MGFQGVAAVYAAIAVGAAAGVASRRIAGGGAARWWGAALEVLVYPLIAAAGLAAGSTLSGLHATSRLAGALAYYTLVPTLASAILARLAVTALRRGLR